MGNVAAVSPVLADDRVQAIDALRGFAILGIFLDNVFGFSGYLFFSSASRESLPTFPLDSVLSLAELTLVNGKFYSLFSILFGLGFAIILERTLRKGLSPLPLFYRRLAILMLVGWIHLRYFWDGDILFLYGFLGLFLPLFRKLSNRALLVSALVLILSPIAIQTVCHLVGLRPGAGLEAMGMAVDSQNGIPFDETFSQYLYNPGAGWTEWRHWTESGWLYRFSYLLSSHRLPKVFGCFLIGYWLGRNRLFVQVPDRRGILLKIRKLGLVLGIPFSLATALLTIFGEQVGDESGVLERICYALGVVPLGLAYGAWIFLSWEKSQGGNWLRWLVPVGRMALTNYLMQTMLGIGLFYGVGLGWGGGLGPTYFLPIAILVFVAQVLFSNLWMRHFQFGPLEWLWRMGTYLRYFPLRKAKAS